MRKQLLFFILTALTGVSIFSTELKFDEVTAGFSQESRSTLLEDGVLTKFHTDQFTPELLLSTDLTEEILNRHLENNCNIGSEILILNKDPEVIKSTLEYYNALLRVETLEGITYWSESKGRDRILFEESWFIDDLESKKKVTVEEVETVPSIAEYYIHQNDTTFGDSESLTAYYNSGEVINMHLQNKTALKLAVLKAVGKDNLSIDLLVVPTDQGVLCYGLISSETIELNIIKKRAALSFYNRIVAINNWFFDQVVME